MKNVKLRILSLLCIGFQAVALASSIPEPSTILYGKVLGTGDAQPFLIQEGTLELSVELPDGSSTLFVAELFPLHNGELSYRLNIPHSAIALELETPDFGIPMPPVAQTNVLMSALVDGELAELLGPSGSAFTIGQLLRAQTLRLDFALPINALDSDGDGIPDWWEDLMGLDKQDPNDGLADNDGDGILNKNEFRYGFNPSQDNRLASFEDMELLAFPGCRTGVRLLAIDSDSASSNVVFTLNSVPSNGQLVVRNRLEDAAEPDQVLVAGDSFSQQEVNEGRLVLVHTNGAPVTAESFLLSVTDGVQAQSASGTVAVTYYEVPENVELLASSLQQRHELFLTGKQQLSVLWDETASMMPVAFAAPSSSLNWGEYLGSYIPSYGAELPQVMAGGRGDDILIGGMADDILIGGAGQDQLTGNGGADTFIFASLDNPSDTILDFNPLEGDLIDLSELLQDRSGFIHETLRFEISGSDTLIGLNVAANDASFTNHVLTLAGIQLSDAAGYELLLAGSIDVGFLKLQPSISVAVTDAEASENGNNSGVFTFTRSGDLTEAFDVALSWSGAAQNGVDYALLASSLHFGSGESEKTLMVSPFADSLIEPAEEVAVILQESTGYRLGAVTQASLTIKDLQSVIGVEVLEAKGTVSPLIPAAFMLTRSGQTANSLVVRLEVSGSASNGSDYQYVASYISFAAGQTSLPIEIRPLAEAVLQNGAESVTISIKADDAYVLADRASGKITLIYGYDSLAEWTARNGGSEVATFALQDPGQFGINNLQRYAYGLDWANPDANLMPKLMKRNGRMQLDLHKNPAAKDIRYIVEASNDLLSWTGEETEIYSLGETADSIFSYELSELRSNSSKQFIRVRVELID